MRWSLKEVLKARGWTAYRLAKESGLTVPAVYRLARQKVQLGRVEGDTLNRFCAALECQPGELLDHVPDKPKRKRG